MISEDLPHGRLKRRTATITGRDNDDEDVVKVKTGDDPRNG